MACKSTKASVLRMFWVRGYSFLFVTFEYIRLSGRLIAIDRSHTKIIFTVTRFLVLLRPNRIGYLNDRYRSIEIVHRCMMLAVQNRTSRHIQARQCSDWSGKWPIKHRTYKYKIVAFIWVGGYACISDNNERMYSSNWKAYNVFINMHVVYIWKTYSLNQLKLYNTESIAMYTCTPTDDPQSV